MSASDQDAEVQAFLGRIGAQIRTLRQQAALSRRELSEQSGVSQRYLAQLESGAGNISVALLYQVARALGQTPQSLLSDEPSLSTEHRTLLHLYDQAEPDQRERAHEALREGQSPHNKGQRICLIGLRGAGKSTLGRLLAQHLGSDFVELNSIIEEQSGIAIGEVMALYGQEGYRLRERRALQTVFEKHQSVVLAVGGGIVNEPATFGQLLHTFHTVWIKALPEEHMDRVRLQGDNRPMEGNSQAMQELRAILSSREKLYARADAMVDTSHQALELSLQDLRDVIADLVQRKR